MKIKQPKPKFVQTDMEPTPNGNHARKHKENVQRRKLRRLKNKAIQAHR